MRKEEQLNSLETFQLNASKTYTSLGYSGDIPNIIFGFIIQCSRVIESMEKEDTILLHKHMGLCAWYIANYCTVNKLKLAEIIDEETLQFEMETDENSLEDYLQKIKDDISFNDEMSDKDKINFVRKMYVSTFPEQYHLDFIKVDRILTNTINDTKITQPKKFV